MKGTRMAALSVLALLVLSIVPFAVAAAGTTSTSSMMSISMQKANARAERANMSGGRYYGLAVAKDRALRDAYAQEYHTRLSIREKLYKTLIESRMQKMARAGQKRVQYLYKPSVKPATPAIPAQPAGNGTPAVPATPAMPAY